MNYRMISAAVVLALLASTHQPAHAAQKLTVDYQRDNLSLNGQWQSMLDHEDEDLWKPDVAAGIAGWQEITVPGMLVTRDLKTREPEARKAIRKKDEADKCAWVRRTFNLTSAQAGRNAALKWGGIRFGAEAWVNGLHITTHPTMGPHTALLPAGALKEGENTIILKVRGWASLPMCAAKPHRPLIPTGASFLKWGSPRTAIYDDIYLEFYDRAYLRWILAMPDLANERVVFRMLLDGASPLPGELKIRAEVSHIGQAPQQANRASLVLAPVSNRIEMTVSIPDPKLWSPETPDMYTARFVVADDKGVCDDVSFRFGMRDIRVEDGHYRLNGKPLWLRGSNLVHEWRSGEPFESQPKRFLVDEARAMSLNSFRTHTGPMPTSWANIADENGIMVLAEMPVLQNFTKFAFTKAEYDLWHENVMIDTPEWITKLWNHPSIIMWVISNESKDSQWEYGPYDDAVKALDPTRPTMRTGVGGKEPHGTKDNLDLHPCANVEKGPEGWLIEKMLDAAAEKDPTRTLTNSEYMNKFRPAKRRALMWTGSPETSQLKLVIADAAAEHTEAMRRVQFDAILPYMYRGWTSMRGANWREEFPTPMAAALHSSMAPVLASLDLFDRNYVTGREVTTPLHLINELHDDVEVQIDIYITPANPLVVPDPEALAAAVWRTKLQRKLKADSIAVEELHWKAPDKPGTYYLAAVLTRQGTRPVVSQRMVRSVLRAETAQRLKAKRLLVLGKDEAVDKFLQAGRADVRTTLPWLGGIKADAVVICNSAELSEDQRKNPGKILKYVRSGGRLVILYQDSWTWKELVDFRIGRGGGWLDGPASRVFPYEAVDHPILAGVDPECLKRWNGLPGTVSHGWVSGAIAPEATRLLWQQDPQRPVVVSLKMGAGEVLICLLKLSEHIDPDSSSYDPVAEQILLNALAPTTGAPQ